MQVLKTKEYLEKLGVCVHIATGGEPDLSGYDLVHLFNLVRPQDILIQTRRARKQGKKIALSTIYAIYTEYDRSVRDGVAGFLSNHFSTSSLEYMKTIARVVKNKEFHEGTWRYLACGHRKSQCEILASIDLLLPNSASEFKRVSHDFPSAHNGVTLIVPNAVDVALFNPGETVVSPEAAKYEGCILCVARIEGIKSQLNLVRAMKGLPWQLLLIGKPAPNHLDYYEKVVKEGGDNVHLLGQIDHELLPQYYKMAKVHALISWMETTGLSSLEAACMGCNLVITEKGDTRDYFGDYAYYCDPESVDSIRAALVRAYEAPVNPLLRRRVLNNFTWEHTARKTLEGYSLVLND